MEMMEKAAMASKGVHQAQFNHIQSISIWFISLEFLIICTSIHVHPVQAANYCG